MDKKNLKDIINKIESNPLGVYNKYSVLIPIIYLENKPYIIYELRSFKLKTQPGEVSFPGGRVEEGESYKEAAVREASEELNIDKESIEIIKEGDYIISPYNFMLKSFIGFINCKFEEIKVNKEEVHEIFIVSIEDLINNPPEEHYVKTKTQIDENFPYELIPEGKNYKWREGKHPVYFYKKNKHIIWGMTARLTKDFVDNIKKLM